MLASSVVLRAHERIDYKRCQMKWFWAWRKGLTPRGQSFGPLEFGIWVHEALARWYQEGFVRDGELSDIFEHVAEASLKSAMAAQVPQHEIDTATQLIALGIEILRAYQVYYRNDRRIEVIIAEIPLEFTFPSDKGGVLATHRLKPDLVFYCTVTKRVMLMEHKTAKQIRTTHLVIDDQARPYGAMAERALKQAGVLHRNESLGGIRYNFLRKALPDQRPTDKHGRSLNKDGTISRRQPAPLFVRQDVLMTGKAKVVTLQRIRREAIEIARKTAAIRAGNLSMDQLNKTPHSSCEKHCQYFSMCVAHENGHDIRHMQETMYVQRDPYAYDEDTTDELTSFEMG